MRHFSPAWALLLFATSVTAACEKADTTSDETEAEERKSRKKKKKKKKKKRDRGQTDASASTTASALPALPPASPTVRTDAPPDLNAPIGAVTTASGLATRVIKRGHGTQPPGPTDTVEVHYSGWTIDGKMFDSSVTRGKTATFGVDKVIKGWTEGLQLMVEGERRRMWIPADLAYGLAPKRTGAPAGRLVFDVELVHIVRAPEVPPDLTAPPADATKTASGLVYKVLQRGTSSAHPTAASKVEVHYSGWTQDGKMFDSSITRGRTAKFGVDKVIKGWTEALQLMSPGDRFRVWIPAVLAYGDTPRRPGAPAGTLVFDIELFAIL